MVWIMVLVDAAFAVALIWALWEYFAPVLPRR